VRRRSGLRGSSGTSTEARPRGGRDRPSRPRRRSPPCEWPMGIRDRDRAEPRPFRCQRCRGPSRTASGQPTRSRRARRSKRKTAAGRGSGARVSHQPEWAPPPVGQHDGLPAGLIAPRALSPSTMTDAPAPRAIEARVARRRGSHSRGSEIIPAVRVSDGSTSKAQASSPGQVSYPPEALLGG
jgi:hypothetical protein